MSSHPSPPTIGHIWPQWSLPAPSLFSPASNLLILQSLSLVSPPSWTSTEGEQDPQLWLPSLLALTLGLGSFSPMVSNSFYWCFPQVEPCLDLSPNPRLLSPRQSWRSQWREAPASLARLSGLKPSSLPSLLTLTAQDLFLPMTLWLWVAHQRMYHAQS